MSTHTERPTGDDGEFLFPVPVEPPQRVSDVPLFYPEEWQLYVNSDNRRTQQEIMERIFIPFLIHAQKFFPPFCIIVKSEDNRDPLYRTSSAVLVALPLDENKSKYLGIIEGDFCIYTNKKTVQTLLSIARTNPTDRRQSCIYVDTDERILLRDGALVSVYDNGRSLAAPVDNQMRISKNEGMNLLTDLFTRMIQDSGYPPSTTLADVFEKNKYGKND